MKKFPRLFIDSYAKTWKSGIIITQERYQNTKNVTFLWDVNIQTDNTMDHLRPGITVFEKETRSCKIVDMACPFDTRVVEKERGKWVSVG